MIKQLHYFKSWLLLMLCMVVGVGSAFAADPDVTYDFTGSDWTASNGTLSNGTVSFSGAGSKNFKMNSGYFILGQKDAYINFPTYSNDVEKIVVIGRSGASGSVGQNIYVGDVAVSTATTGATGTNTYEIASDYQAAGTQYTLKVTSAHNTQITKIEVYYKTSDPSDTRTATSITIDDSGITNTDLYEGTAAGTLSATVMAGDAAVTGASVIWESDDDAVATVDENTGVVTLVGAGSTIITASFAGDETNYKPSTDTYELTVTNTDPNAPGTENNPYTVAQAIAATPASGTSANVYIRGIVSNFYSTSIVDDGTNYRYYISDDGTETNQLLVYRGKGLNNVAFSSADDLQIGDEVVILGGLTTYSNAPEVAANNYIVSITQAPKAPLESITLSGADIDNVPAFYVNGEFTHNVTVTAHYADNSTKDVTSSATFTAPDMTTAGEGKTVTVSYTEGEDEQAITKTATYPINVYEITTHTLLWVVNGDVASYDDNFPVGQPIPFPANLADIEGKTFVGWVENTIDGTTDTAPEFVTSAIMPDHSMTYYAVFADKTETIGEVTKTYGFETESDPDWTIAGPVREEGNANTGSYAGKINTNNTYVTFNNKVKATEFSFAFKRTSDNNNYNVYVETSTDNSTWTAAETYPMSGFSNGSYTNETKTFDGVTEQYVRFHCSNTTAVRYVDDITITYNGTQESYSAYCTTVAADTRQEAGISFANENVEAEYAVPYYGESLTNPNNVTPITWTSTNETVATVSNAGAVTVLAVGETTIKATFVGNDTYKPAEVSYTLNVVDSRTALTMTFDPASVSATVNETTITAPTLTIKDENDEDVTGLTIGYISDNDEVATVTDEGVVTLKGVAGNATITAQFAGNNQYLAAFADYTITVTDPSAKVTKFEKVTSTADITDGEYLIVYEEGSVAFNGSLAKDGLDVARNTVEVVINNNEIEGDETIDAATFTIDTTAGTLQSTSGSYYIGVTSYSNGLKTSDTGIENSFSIDESGNAVITVSTSDGDMTLRYNSAENQNRFRYYKSGQQAIQLYKKVEVYVLDDTSNGNAAKIAAINGQTVNVKVERTLSSQYYNTLFLPFAMTADQVKAAFGENVQVATFTGMNSDTQFGFGNVTAMEANTGYLVRPAAAVNGFTVEGVTITSAATVTPSSDWIMYGSYDTFENSDANEVYYFTTSGKVKKLASTGSIKGLRAFMMKGATEETVKAINSNVELTFGGGGDGTGGSTPQARVDFTLSLEDDTTTGINSIDNSQLTIDNDAPAYNLAGQKVGKGYKGIVVKNGKKVVIK